MRPPATEKKATVQCDIRTAAIISVPANQSEICSDHISQLGGGQLFWRPAHDPFHFTRSL